MTYNSTKTGEKGISECLALTLEFLINVLDGINVLEGNFPKI